MKRFSLHKNKLDLSLFFFIFSLILFFSAFFSISEPKAEVEYPTVNWIVEEGDSLWMIAKNNLLEDTMTIQEMVYLLQSLNGLENVTIFPGQEILIPIPIEMGTSS